MEPILNKCRCCMREGEFTQNVYRDSYLEMFRETLNLLPINDSRLPRWICPGCVDSLEAAKRFRDMVVAAEKQLIHALTYTYCDGVAATQPVDNVWIKEEARDVDTDCEENEDMTFRDLEDAEAPSLSYKADMADSNTLTPQKRYSEDQIQFKAKRESHDFISMRSGEKDDFVSDTVMYNIKKEKIDDANTACGDGDRMADVGSPTQNTLIIVPDVGSMLHNFTEEHPVKTATSTEGSNTKRRLTTATKLRENIILLMQHSTIVPFRHNSNFLKDYICYYCENTYDSMNELREHTESQHVGKVSDEAIMTCMRTRAHKLINADISCIKCRLCDVKVYTIETLIEHLTKVHKKVYHGSVKKTDGILGFVLGTNELKCHLCDKTFGSFKFLYSHMNEHYEAYNCYCCQKKFVNLLQYRTHMKTHIIREEKDFKCDHCGISCKTKTGLVYHMKRHHLNVTLKCEHCPETFRFKEYRKREEHMVEAHGMQRQEHKYMCEICQNGKVYSSKNTLKIHKSNVHKVGDVLRIQCQLCEFVTHHTKRMKEHMDVHNGVKNYGCDLCGKRFTKPYTLRVHMRMHLNDKRYACPLCEAAFVHKNVLQYHVKKKHPESDVTI